MMSWCGGSTPRPSALLFAALALSSCLGQHPQQQQPPNQTAKRFEYKYSFKPPYLAQKDGTVPFFTYFGNAIASEESVRITPSLRSQKGSIWSKMATTFDWWEVEIHFRVTGRGRIGADGLAFWYTQSQGVEGPDNILDDIKSPVFGSSDRWNGLGIFFDSFDNDNKHNNPYIMAMVNDGTKNYDHQNDGSTQQLAGCLRDFRNKPFPVKVKIEYFNNVLTVLFHNGMSNNERDFEVCMRVENVFLPKAGHFGISAATGGLADDHDVHKFTVHSLRSPEAALKPDSINEEESKKFEEEFQQYQDKLKEQKDQWAKEHPDQVKDDPDDWENWFSDQDKELQQIFQGQSDMKDVLHDLHRKMDEIIGRQERTLSLLAQGGVQQVGGPQGGGGGGAPIPVDTIRRDEVNAVLANQREIVTASRDIKNFVMDIHTKTGQILTKGTGSVQQVGGPSAGGGYDVSKPVQEMKESLNIVRRDLAAVSQKLNQPNAQARGGGGANCPDPPPTNCVTTMVFVGLMAVQLVITISYLMYRDSKEAQAKKFY